MGNYCIYCTSFSVLRRFAGSEMRGMRRFLEPQVKYFVCQRRNGKFTIDFDDFFIYTGNPWKSPIVMLGLPDQYFQDFPGSSRWNHQFCIGQGPTQLTFARGFSKGKLLVRWCQTWGCCYWVGIAAVGAATSQLVVVNSLTMAITIINHY